MPPPAADRRRQFERRTGRGQQDHGAGQDHRSGQGQAPAAEPVGKCSGGQGQAPCGQVEGRIDQADLMAVAPMARACRGDHRQAHRNGQIAAEGGQAAEGELGGECGAVVAVGGRGHTVALVCVIRNLETFFDLSAGLFSLLDGQGRFQSLFPDDLELEARFGELEKTLAVFFE